MGAGGALLTLGLVQRWGEVYPRWIPYLRGKPVRPRTAIVPASLVAILITSAGLTYVRTALGAATLAYHLRRRRACGRCGRS